MDCVTFFLLQYNKMKFVSSVCTLYMITIWYSMPVNGL